MKYGAYIVLTVLLTNFSLLEAASLRGYTKYKCESSKIQANSRICVGDEIENWLQKEDGVVVGVYYKGSDYDGSQATREYNENPIWHTKIKYRVKGRLKVRTVGRERVRRIR